MTPQILAESTWPGGTSADGFELGRRGRAERSARATPRPAGRNNGTPIGDPARERMARRASGEAPPKIPSP